MLLDIGHHILVPSHAWNIINEEWGNHKEKQ